MNTDTTPPGVYSGLRPFVMDARGRAGEPSRELASWLISRLTRQLIQTRSMTLGTANAAATNAFWLPISCILIKSWSLQR
eukprot:1365940-Amphidinium_carterae.1